MKPARLVAEQLSWSPGRGRERLLHETGFALEPGQVLGILGPNGAGKTTLLRLLYRFHRPQTGRVLLDGENLWHLSQRRVAQRVAVVLQEQPSDLELTVHEIVALGRTPHRRGPASGGTHEQEIIAHALAQLELIDLADRRLSTLSGGERQRVLVARALAQEPGLLILDEPTNHLDIRHQLEILNLIRSLPLTIVTSLHDLNLAADVCDQLLLMQAGQPLGFGPPEQVLNEAAVSQAFGVHVQRERLVPSERNHLTFHLHEIGSLS